MGFGLADGKIGRIRHMGLNRLNLRNCWDFVSDMGKYLQIIGAQLWKKLDKLWGCIQCAIFR